MVVNRISMESRKVVRLSSPPSVFELAWKGRAIAIPRGMQIGMTDILVLGSRFEDGKVASAREVQGRLVRDAGADGQRYFSPVFRWDLGMSVDSFLE
jgi:hypothetical protein